MLKSRFDAIMKIVTSVTRSHYKCHTESPKIVIVSDGSNFDDDNVGHNEECRILTFSS